MDNKLNNFVDKILIISLPGDESLFQQTRDDLIKHGFNGSKIVKIPGVKHDDTRVIKMFEQGKVHTKNPHLTPYRIGNWLAHYDAWKYISTNKIKSAMICEDDIFILDSRWRRINRYTRKIYQAIQKSADTLIRLSVTPQKKKKKGVYRDKEVHGSLCSNPCYIIDYKFAKKLMKGAQQKITVTSDVYVHDIQAKHVRNAYSLLPPVWKDRTWYTQEIESRVRPKFESSGYEKDSLNLSLLVGSTDSYSWLWEGFLYFFNKEWDEQCNIEKYLISETKELNSPKFKSILSEKEYTDQLAVPLSEIKTDYVLWLQEDYWLTRPVTKDFLFNIVTEMEIHNIDKVAMHKCTYTQSYDYSDIAGKNNDLIRIHPKSKYLIDVQPTIWKTEFFKKCLPQKQPESPWVFELNATKRAQKMTPTPKIYLKETELTPKGGVIIKGRKNEQYYKMVKELKESKYE